MTFRGGEEGHPADLSSGAHPLAVGGRVYPQLYPALGSGVMEHLNCPQWFDENAVTSGPPEAIWCLE